MRTKYDIGQEVYLKGRVTSIKCYNGDKIEYRIKLYSNNNYVDMVPENEVYGGDISDFYHKVIETFRDYRSETTEDSMEDSV